MDHQPPKPRKSQHAQIVQDLGMHIVSGRFKPEERLPMEATLCEEYQVSRSVLREATRVLSAKGLVYSKPRVGAVVRPRLKWHLLDPDVLSWLMQSTPHSEFFNTLAGVRRILEPEIAAMAATTAISPGKQSGWSNCPPPPPPWLKPCVPVRSISSRRFAPMVPANPPTGACPCSCASGLRMGGRA